MLKHILDTKPKYKEVIDNLIDNPKPEIVDVVRPVIEDSLKKERIIGIEIGWLTAFLQMYKKILNMQSAQEIKDCIRKEADDARKRLGLESAFDEYGNVIIENETKEIVE